MIVLPDAVRSRVVALAADVLGRLPTDDVPATLRPVARFAATKRARLGANAIAAALEDDAGFRRRVADAAAQARPEIASGLGQGAPPAAADPVDVVVIAYLARPSGWEELVEAAATVLRQSQDDALRAREAAAAERARQQLDAARASARELRTTMKAEVDRLKADNTTLRRRLQQTREQLNQLRQQEREEQETAAHELSAARTALRAAEADARRLRARLSEAEGALEAARRDGRAERGLGTARLALLLDTLVEAAGGLRRELALPASSLQPADTVDAAAPGDPQAAGAAGGAHAADDPRRLEELLTLPKAHMIVDGYNVTKTAWSAMPLQAQRSRLVSGLAAVAARTGAEITCVFDGADVSAPPPVASAQGVRVRFSPAGQSADEVIRRMVQAEPEGRRLVVVSSDREVAEGVRRPGASSVEAAALVSLLAR